MTGLFWKTHGFLDIKKTAMALSKNNTLRNLET